MSETLWTALMRCPKCSAEGGRPHSVESKTAAKVTITVQCTTCGHEWIVERDTPMFVPPPDKRTPPEEPA